MGSGAGVFLSTFFSFFFRYFAYYFLHFIIALQEWSGNFFSGKNGFFYFFQTFITCLGFRHGRVTKELEGKGRERKGDIHTHIVYLVSSYYHVI